MTKTTIEIPESTKQKLRDERLEHETNYAQTIERLLGESNTEFVTESQVREILHEELSDFSTNEDSSSR
jgi:hypothetical protein